MNKLLNKTHLKLAQDLISKKSITPEDDGAIDVLKKFLEKLGFKCHVLEFSSVDKKKQREVVKNLFAIKYAKNINAPLLCFAGHTDVVPVGNIKNWKYNPFSGTIKNNVLYGRGASDMKAAIAAWSFACSSYIKNNSQEVSLAFMITGDEEGNATNGTIKLIEWIKKKKIHIDHCIVGEPTNPSYIGEMIKVGRRGSLNLKISVSGKLGHVAYPHLAKNPLPIISLICSRISKINFAKKSNLFPKSNLEITSINCNNTATNVIPEIAEASLNIRYNSAYNSKEIINKINMTCKKITMDYKIEVISSSEPFFTKPEKFIDALIDSIKTVCKKKPILSTTGGTSDARFIKNICPVVEFGALGKTMHQTNENITVSDFNKLCKIYELFIKKYAQLF